MIAMNDRMRTVLRATDLAGGRLPEGMQEIVRQGFLDVDGGVFLRGLLAFNGSAALVDFPDLTGYECFINSIHVDDHAADAYLALACRYAQAVLDAWRARGAGPVARVIVSGDEEGAVVKFHVVRSGESWLAGDLEGYEEAVLWADSNEAWVFT